MADPPTSAPLPIANAFGPAGAMALSFRLIRSLILSDLVLNFVSSAKVLKTWRRDTFCKPLFKKVGLTIDFVQASRLNILYFFLDFLFPENCNENYEIRRSRIFERFLFNFSEESL